MERTISLRHDLDWLPPRYRAIRWTIAGSIWTVMAGGFGSLLAFGHIGAVAGGAGKGIAVLAAGGYYAGDKVARSVLRGRLRKLASGAVETSRLPAEADGELVHVVGRVRLMSAHAGRNQVSGLIDPAPAVWRRIVFNFGNEAKVLYEAAVDFQLVGDGGEPIVIETAEARLLAADPKSLWILDSHPAVAQLEALPLPTDVQNARALRQRRRDKGKKVPKLRVSELLLREGDLVEVLGYKSRVIDPTMGDRMERETPFRATLRGGRAFPLLIAPRKA
jgi:hypothetical protein